MQIADGAVGYLRTAASLPVRGAGFGLGVATYGGAVAADLVATTTRTATQLAGELMGGTPVRRTSTHHGRAWIEVRGLEGARGDDVAAGVLAAVRSLDGVDRAELNRSLSRLIVTVGASGPSVAELCTVIAGAEDRARPSVPDAAGDRSKELPGDDVTLAERSLALAAVTTGFVAALAGRLIPIPGLPWPVPAAAVTFVNYQPRLRGMVEDRLGPDAAELLLATAQAAGDVVRQAPASLAVDMVLRSRSRPRPGRADAHGGGVNPNWRGTLPTTPTASQSLATVRRDRWSGTQTARRSPSWWGRRRWGQPLAAWRAPRTRLWLPHRRRRAPPVRCSPPRSAADSPIATTCSRCVPERCAAWTVSTPWSSTPTFCTRPSSGSARSARSAIPTGPGCGRLPDPLWTPVPSERAGTRWESFRMISPRQPRTTTPPCS